VCLTGLIFDLIPFTQKIDKDKSTVKNAWVYVSRVYIFLFDPRGGGQKYGQMKKKIIERG